MSTSSIAEIRRVRFWARASYSKREILMQGRPQPPLPGFCFLVDTEGEHETSQPFHPSHYDRYPWLTACESQNRLFCWPCLLLVDDNVWNTGGLRSPCQLSQLRAHEKKPYHLKAALKLKLFADKLGILQPSTCDRLNEVLARRNREVLRRVIDAINFVVLQRRLCSKQSVDPLTAEECVVAVNFLSVSGTNGEDSSLAKDAAFLLENDVGFLSNVISAISNVLQFAIKKEAHGSPFVSIVLTGHKRESRILRSTVLRFVKDGRVQERFIGFYKEDDCKEETFLIQKLIKVVSDYQLDKKLVAVSVDGLCPYATVCTLSKIIVSKYPHALFVPCYFHRYFDVMVQALSCNGNIPVFVRDTFFKVMESMMSFLREHYDEVEDYLLSDIRSYTDVAFLRSEVVEVESARSLIVLNWIKSSRVELIEFFRHASAADNLKEEDVNRVSTFGKFLADFDTMFWLLFFIRLFVLLKDAHTTLDSPNPEVLFTSRMLPMALSLLRAENETHFKSFWKSVVNYLITQMIAKVSLSRTNLNNSASAVLFSVVKQTSARLNHLRSLAFFKLLKPPSNFYPAFTDLKQLVSNLVRKYAPFFDGEALEKEVHELYENNHALVGFSIEQLLEYMTRQESRRKNLPNMIKLAELVLAMPCVKPSGARPPVIQKIKALDRSRKCSKSLDFSVLYVENELLEEIRQGKTFYDDVIDVFSQIMNKDKGMLLS